MVLRIVNAAVVGVVVACSVVGLAQPPPPAPPAVADESREPTSDLECEMSCGADKASVPTVELRWDPGKDRRAARRSEQRIEATVYKTGFAQGEFTALALAAGDKPAAPGVKFARIDRTPGKQAPPSLELKVTKATLAKAPKAKLVVRAEGLEPGLTYFWRLSSRVGNGWLASQVVRCQAPVCPVDAHLTPRSPP